MTVRLISWNINKRRAIGDQVAALSECQPDLVALQEVKARHLDALRELFAQVGLPYVLDSKTAPEISHRGYVVIASRWPLKRKAAGRSSCAESTLSALAKSPHGSIEIHAVHVPNIGNGDLLKCRFLEELYTRLARPCPHHRILCGDFNFPQRELSDGTVITFGEKIRADGSFYVPRGWERQAATERQIMQDLADFDLRDVYRSVNGFTPQDHSWVAQNRGRAFGYRLDHILASHSLNPLQCVYLHPFRENRLSDHSPIEAVFSP